MACSRKPAARSLSPTPSNPERRPLPWIRLLEERSDMGRSVPAPTMHTARYWSWKLAITSQRPRALCVGCPAIMPNHGAFVVVHSGLNLSSPQIDVKSPTRHLYSPLKAGHTRCSVGDRREVHLSPQKESYDHLRAWTVGSDTKNPQLHRGLNPVRAGLVKDASDYRWSSAYVGRTPPSLPLDPPGPALAESS